MQIENIEGIKKEQILPIMKSCEQLEKYVSNLKIVAQNLQKSSEEIVDYLAQGNVSDNELNRQLWHGLNNIEHQVKQFTVYTETSTHDFAAASGKLIETLQSLRPDVHS